MLLYQKNTVGRTYTRLITNSPLVFIIFIVFGIVLFLTLTLKIQIDVIRTYPAEVVQLKGEFFAISINAEGITAGSAYLYSNKNEAVYPVVIEKTEQSEDKMLLHFNNNGEGINKELYAKKIFIDIPQGKETLLYRILAKGGKGFE